ncbi:MAG TPA: hypothetical protein VFU13_05575 [Steroidobacteraceae bacterium]|nr:hypothetical protein [Steroidobacteraceae bacterium]
MKPILKVLLAIEVLVCFGPLTIVLLLGLVIAPLQLAFLFSAHDEARPGAALVLAAVAAGMAGMAALVNVLLWLFSPPSHFLGPRWTLAAMVLGMLPVAFYAFGPVDSVAWRLAGLLPLACTFHLAWLARGFLFSAKSSWTSRELDA